MKITCCKNCQGRYVGCHADCEEYKEQKKHLNNFNEKKRREHEAQAFRNLRVDDLIAAKALRNVHKSTSRLDRKWGGNK